jgi:hypothetical protein
VRAGHTGPQSIARFAASPSLFGWAGCRFAQQAVGKRDPLVWIVAVTQASTAHDGQMAFVFGTSEGKRQSPGNVRTRVLGKAA